MKVLRSGLLISGKWQGWDDMLISRFDAIAIFKHCDSTSLVIRYYDLLIYRFFFLICILF